MSSTGSKTWLLAFGAAVAIAGGIYILYLNKKKDHMKIVKRAIDALGPPEIDTSGKATFAYLKKVYYIAVLLGCYETFKPLKD